MFTALLRETVEPWNFRIAAYCLMPDSYPMLVETPDADSSRGMRHLNGVYTQRFNVCHHSTGETGDKKLAQHKERIE